MEEEKKELNFLRCIQLGVRNDDELSKLFRSATIATGGFLLNIHKNLLPEKIVKGKEISSVSQELISSLGCELDKEFGVREYYVSNDLVKES